MYSDRLNRNFYFNTLTQTGQFDVPEELKDIADEVYDVGLDATTLENTSSVPQPVVTNHTYHPSTPGIVEVNLRRSTRTRRSASYLSPSENVNEVQSTQLPLQSSAIRSARRCSSSRLLGGDQEEREDVCDMTADDVGEEDSPSERQQELSLYSSADDNRILVPQTQTQAEMDVDPAGTVGWGCEACTFINRPEDLLCAMCSSPCPRTSMQVTLTDDL